MKRHRYVCIQKGEMQLSIPFQQSISSCIINSSFLLISCLLNLNSSSSIHPVTSPLLLFHKQAIIHSSSGISINFLPHQSALKLPASNEEEKKGNKVQAFAAAKTLRAPCVAVGCNPVSGCSSASGKNKASDAVIQIGICLLAEMALYLFFVCWSCIFSPFYFAFAFPCYLSSCSSIYLVFEEAAVRSRRAVNDGDVIGKALGPMIEHEYALAEALSNKALRKREQEAAKIDEIEDIDDPAYDGKEWDDFDDGAKKYRHKRSKSIHKTSSDHPLGRKKKQIVHHVGDWNKNTICCPDRYPCSNSGLRLCPSTPVTSDIDSLSVGPLNGAVRNTKKYAIKGRVRRDYRLPHKDFPSSIPSTTSTPAPHRSLKQAPTFSHIPNLIVVEPPTPLLNNDVASIAHKPQDKDRYRPTSIKPLTDDSRDQSGVSMFSGESPRISMKRKPITHSLRHAAVSPAASSTSHDHEEEGEEEGHKDKEEHGELAKLGKGLKHHSKEGKGKNEQRQKSTQIHRGK